MSKHICLVFLASLLFVSAVGQLCQTASTANDQLQTGTVNVFNQFGGPRDQTFSITLNYNLNSNPVQAVASSSSLSVNTANGLDLAIRMVGGTSTANIVVLLDQDNTWSSLTVSYLITSRTDFIVGSFIADTYFSSAFSSTITLTHRISNWVANSNQWTAVAQFTGIRTSTSGVFQVSFISLSLDRNLGQLTVLVSVTQSAVIETLQIGYIVKTNTSPILYSSFSPQNSISSPYLFIGVESFSSSGQSYMGSAFSSASQSGLTCIGALCPSSCISVLACETGNGQRIGNTCYMCGSGFSIVNGACQAISPCGANEVFSNGQCVCVSGYVEVNNVCYLSCGPNAYVFLSQCTCIPGYTFSNTLNQCTTTPTCPPNYVQSNGVCICPSPLGLINGQCTNCPTNAFRNSTGFCQCVSGYSLNPSTRQCISSNPCFPNAYLNSQGECICNDGYYRQGNQCIYFECSGGRVYNGVGCVCPAGQYWDLLTLQCTVCNAAGRIISGNNCVCSQSFYPSGTVCLPCPSNSLYSSTLNQCVCISGYVLQNGQCIATPSCPTNSQYNPTLQRCECNNAGWQIINNICTPCPANSAWDGQQCQCNAPYYLYNGVCTPCPTLAAWNGLECVCQPGLYLYQNQCIQCGSNASWNGAECVCNSGFILSGNNCIPVNNCPANSNWNTQTQSCICISGYFLIGGQCVTCDPNSSYSSAQGTCVCNTGFYGTYQSCSACDSSCSTCTGPANTQCTTCADGRTVNNGVCTGNCPSGFYVNATNGCSACLANCALCFSGTSCDTCQQGYNLNVQTIANQIVVTCDAPPTGANSVLSLNNFIIGNNKVYQGASLSLMPTQILAAGCTICNDLLSVQAISSTVIPTITVEFVTNSQYWFVIEFDFGSAAFIPDFQFTVKINPIHATFFTSADMSQMVNRVYTQSMLQAPAPSIALLRTTSPSLTVASGSAPTSTTLTSSQLDEIFG